MKQLIRLIVIFAAIFGSTFLIAKLTGFLETDQITGWLVEAKESSSMLVGIIVTVLLAADLFIAVPTLSLTILSGYFLGFGWAIFYSLFGMILAGVVGYWLSRLFGERILCFLIKDQTKRNEVIASFERHGFTMILLSRAVPILPEVTACLSGLTGMSFFKFLSAWLISSIPYVLIATYFGSISTLDDPKPAILAAVGITSFLWICWYLFSIKQKK